MNIDLFGNIIDEPEEYVLEKVKKPSPFSFVNNISSKKYPETLEGYSAFLTNMGFSQRKDTVVFANELNKYFDLPDKAQFDFYFFAMPKRSYFSKWAKGVQSKYSTAIKEKYKVSEAVAREYEKILNPEQLEIIQKWHESRKGGK